MANESPTPTVQETLDAVATARGLRYTYPADVGDVPAGTKLQHSYFLNVSEPVLLPVDEVNAPSHYTHLPVECIDVAEHFGYRLGNVIKYVWRADFKGKPIQDLEKAAYYLSREIEKRKAAQ